MLETERLDSTMLPAFAGVLLLIVVGGCASAPSGDAAAAIPPDQVRQPDPETRRLQTCAAIVTQLDLLGVNQSGDPFRYPGYRNRELGDPNSPGTDIQRLQMDYQRYRCYL